MKSNSQTQRGDESKTFDNKRNSKKIIRLTSSGSANNDICANCGKKEYDHFIKLGGKITDDKIMCYQDSERLEEFVPKDNSPEINKKDFAKLLEIVKKKCDEATLEELEECVKFLEESSSPDESTARNNDDGLSRTDGDSPKKKQYAPENSEAMRDKKLPRSDSNPIESVNVSEKQTSSADNNQVGCGKYVKDGFYCGESNYLCPTCKEKKDNNSSKDKVSNDEGVSCLPASPLDAFSDEVLKSTNECQISSCEDEILNKIYPRMVLVSEGRLIFSKRDLKLAISLTAQKVEKVWGEKYKSLFEQSKETAQKMQEITNQDITNFYKDKEINYADALLFKTAQNNFKAGQESQKQKMQKEIDELKKFYDIIFKRYEEAIIEQKEELRTSINTEWNEKVKKLKEEIEAEIKVAEKYIKEHTKHSNAEQSILIMRMVLMSINRIFGGKE